MHAKTHNPNINHPAHPHTQPLPHTSHQSIEPATSPHVTHTHAWPVGPFLTNLVHTRSGCARPKAQQMCLSHPPNIQKTLILTLHKSTYLPKPYL